MAIGFNTAGTATFRNSGSPLSVPVPSGTAAGDLLLLVATSFIGGSGGVAITTPSGYTLLASAPNAPTDYWIAVYYKVAGASEPSASVTTASTSALDARIFGFTGVDGTTPIDVSGSFGSPVTGTTVNVPSITTATANAWQIAIGVDPGNAATASSVPSGWTLRWFSNTFTIIVVDSVLRATAGATSATSYPRSFAGSPGLDPITFALRLAGASPPVAPVANFTGTPTSGTASLGVTFTDSSTNTPTSWAWTFGDGGTSTSQNPSHSYTTSGVYTVALTATNSGGSNTLTRTGYVTVGETINYATGGGITIW